MSSIIAESSTHNLHSKAWCADTYDGNVIWFQPDGTGEIVSRAELNLCLAAHFSWRLVETKSIDSAASTSPSVIDRLFKRSTTEIISIMVIEISISRDDAPLSLLTSGAHMNPLREIAYGPQQYTVVVERGLFAPQRDLGPRDPCKNVGYGLQMTLDRSPYPPKDAWPDKWSDMVEDMLPFEQLVFVAERIGDEQS